MSNRRLQSNRCKLLLDLVTKSHKDKASYKYNTDQIILYNNLPKLNNTNDNNEIMENVDVIVSLGNNF